MSKIFVWVCTTVGRDVVCAAMAEDGEVLAEHMSSNETWARHDMGFTSDWKHDAYKEHYPDGYELVWIESTENEEFLAAFKKNQEQKEEAEKNGP